MVILAFDNDVFVANKDELYQLEPLYQMRS